VEETVNKVWENRLRRVADRRGYLLMKSRSRDPRAVDFGCYALVDMRTGEKVNPTIANRWVCSWSLVDVENWLSRSGY
jgi:hypothetical protein